jgi:hypothetical protein
MMPTVLVDVLMVISILVYTGSQEIIRFFPAGKSNRRLAAALGASQFWWRSRGRLFCSEGTVENSPQIYLRVRAANANRVPKGRPKTQRRTRAAALNHPSLAFDH